MREVTARALEESLELFAIPFASRLLDIRMVEKSQSPTAHARKLVPRRRVPEPRKEEHEGEARRIGTVDLSPARAIETTAAMRLERGLDRCQRPKEPSLALLQRVTTVGRKDVSQRVEHRLRVRHKLALMRAGYHVGGRKHRVARFIDEGRCNPRVVQDALTRCELEDGVAPQRGERKEPARRFTQGVVAR